MQKRVFLDVLPGDRRLTKAVFGEQRANPVVRPRVQVTMRDVEHRAGQGIAFIECACRVTTVR